jgi:hypothetical protein
MDLQIDKLVDGSGPEPAPRRNRGRFQAGDPRINRRGRPRADKAAPRKDPPDRAPCADRLAVLFVPAADLAYRLTRELAPWIVNLPQDCAVVGCRFDAARSAVAVVIRSTEFPVIPPGAVIPEFRPAFNGLWWRRR